MKIILTPEFWIVDSGQDEISNIFG